MGRYRITSGARQRTAIIRRCTIRPSIMDSDSIREFIWAAFSLASVGAWDLAAGVGVAIGSAAFCSPMGCSSIITDSMGGADGAGADGVDASGPALADSMVECGRITPSTGEAFLMQTAR